MSGCSDDGLADGSADGVLRGFREANGSTESCWVGDVLGNLLDGRHCGNREIFSEGTNVMGLKVGIFEAGRFDVQEDDGLYDGNGEGETFCACDGRCDGFDEIADKDADPMLDNKREVSS